MTNHTAIAFRRPYRSCVAKSTRNHTDNCHAMPVCGVSLRAVPCNQRIKNRPLQIVVVAVADVGISSLDQWPVLFHGPRDYTGTHTHSHIHIQPHNHKHTYTWSHTKEAKKKQRNSTHHTHITTHAHTVIQKAQNTKHTAQTHTRSHTKDTTQAHTHRTTCTHTRSRAKDTKHTRSLTDTRRHTTHAKTRHNNVRLQPNQRHTRHRVSVRATRVPNTPRKCVGQLSTPQATHAALSLSSPIGYSMSYARAKLARLRMSFSNSNSGRWNPMMRRPDGAARTRGARQHKRKHCRANGKKHRQRTHQRGRALNAPVGDKVHQSRPLVRPQPRPLKHAPNGMP